LTMSLTFLWFQSEVSNTGKNIGLEIRFMCLTS
jgi:hypothetical protein